MLFTDAHLAELSDDQRQVLETWLVEFDLSWDEGQLASWVRRLASRGDCLRQLALVEMVKIDLERRWQRGQRACLEAYLNAIPELGTLDSLPTELLLAEYEARQLCGAPADLAQFARRFPRQAGELRWLVGQSQNEAVSANGRALQETPRPADHETDASCPSLFPGAVAPACSTPLPALLAGSPVRLTERLGRYHILRELGRGAMGTVYLAHDSQLDRLVALKVPQFTAADGPEVRQRFLSEARAAATIEHPNVCPVYDVGEIDGTPYLTMAFLHGQPLSRLLEEPTPLSERQAASLVHQLTGALQAAHERGVIHRDLKPSNIMLNARGEPVILDFGLARRQSENGARITQIGQPVGTPAYMSPEQVAGALGVMGPGCDIYALGIILYQLLTGRLPFEGSVAEVLGQIIAQQPEPPSKRRPGLDPRLEKICLKALSKEVADRYASMRDLGAALGDYLRADPPPAAGQVDRTALPPKVWLSRKSLWLLLGGLATAAVVVLASYLWVANSIGTIGIDLDGPRTEIEVQVDGERIESASLNEPLHLRPGKHHLLVTGKRIQSVSTSFTVVRGDNPILRIQLVPQDDDDPRRHDDDDHKERKDDHKERNDDRKERDDDRYDD
jgi:serine/threonine protein kinase